MRTPIKLAGFGAGLALAFGAAAGIGQAAGPTLEVEDTMNHSDMSGTPGHGDDHTKPEGAKAAEGGHGGHGDTDEEAAPETASASLPGGLMVSQDGYTLQLEQTQLPAGGDVQIAATILDADGVPVTEFEVKHEKELHLIAVRRDATGFQHVHPVMDAAGTWRTELDLRPGQWRIFTDIAPTGADALTLGADLAVAGDYTPLTPPDERRSTPVAGGYTVSIEGDMTVGEEAELTLTVKRDGRPVTDLDPYLGAYGHLVALREGDLAYLHVHPDGAPDDGQTEPGPEVTFYAEAPSAGSYQLFLDFKHNGVVRTAPLALTAATATEAAAATDTTEEADTSNSGSDSGGPEDSDDGTDGDEGHSDDGHSH